MLLSELRVIVFLAQRGLVESVFSTSLLVVAVAVGVGFQLPSSANLQGFRAELLAQSLDSGSGDVRVRPRRGAFLQNADALAIELSKNPLVQEATAVVGAMAEVRFNNTANNFTVVGVDPEARFHPYRVISGESLDESDDSLLLGISVAKRLAVQIGDQIELRVLLSPRPRLVLDDGGYGVYTMTVRGLVGFGASDGAFVPRRFLSEELGDESVASAVFVHLHSHNDAAVVAAELTKRYPELESRAWIDDSPYLRSTVAAVETLGSIAWLMGILASGIPLLALLYINTLHRRRQIGLLSAMGFSRADVFVLFMAQAIMLAVAGCFVGTLIATAIIKYSLNHPVFDWQSFVIRPQLLFRDLSMTLFIVLLTSVAAGTYPAWRASRVNPSKILRGIE